MPRLAEEPDRYRLALTDNTLTPDQAVGRVHGNSSDCVFSHVIGDFQNEPDVMVLHFQCGSNVG